MNLIELKDIRKTYFSGDIPTPVLQGLDLTIKHGEFVSIMGPSGAGKSTLLHILGFLDRQTSGEYLFEERKMDDLSELDIAKDRNEKMGFIFQSFNLLPRTSVLENVKLPLAYSQVKPSAWNERALAAIKAVGLSHRIDHQPNQLSGGEMQRVAIARALINKPSVIFADEPTGNLDTHSGEAVMKILQKLNQSGHTIILITHEKQVALHAQRIIHIVDGNIDKDEKVKSCIIPN